MTDYHFTNYPVAYSPDQYESTLAEVTTRLRSMEGVKAIYQFGNVKAPGISDLDILVVFKSGTKMRSNPIDRSRKQEGYFFAHNLFGLDEEKVDPFVLFQPHFSGKLIWGDGRELVRQYKQEGSSALWEQIAIEYLLKNFLVSLSQQLSGVVKVRQLLLEANATLYDLEILNETGRLRELVEQLIRWRGHWFDQPVSRSALSIFFEEYCFEQHVLMTKLFTQSVLFVPEKASISLSRNLAIRDAGTFGAQRKHSFLRYLIQNFPWDKAARAFQKLQQAEVAVPMQAARPPSLLHRRFAFMKEAIRYNAEYIPYFAAPVSVIPFP